MIRALLGLALLAVSGCAPAGCDGPALGAPGRPTGPNHYVAPADLASGGGGGPVTRAQITNYNDAGNISSASAFVTFSSAISAGGTIVACIESGDCNGTGIATFSDDAGNTYTQIDTLRSYPPACYTAAVMCAYAKNVSSYGANMKVTATALGGGFDSNRHTVLQAVLYTGTSTSAPIKNHVIQNSSAPGMNTVNMKSGAFTDAASSYDLGWGTALNESYGWTASGSWSAIGSPTTGVFFIEQPSVNGSTEATGNTGSNEWVMAGIALQ